MEKTTRKNALETRLRTLIEDLYDIEQTLDQPANKDVEERSVEREGDEVLQGLGALERSEVEQIRAALERMKAGEYGFCVTCGAEIDPKRLDLLPATPFCAKCAP